MQQSSLVILQPCWMDTKSFYPGGRKHSLNKTLIWLLKETPCPLFFVTSDSSFKNGQRFDHFLWLFPMSEGVIREYLLSGRFLALFPLIVYLSFFSSNSSLHQSMQSRFPYLIFKHVLFICFWSLSSFSSSPDSFFFHSVLPQTQW